MIAGVRGQLDHAYLNDIPGPDTPRLENVAQWIWGKLDRVEARRGPDGVGEGAVHRGGH